jgi:hypothetical protein
LASETKCKEVAGEEGEKREGWGMGRRAERAKEREGLGRPGRGGRKRKSRANKLFAVVPNQALLHRAASKRRPQVISCETKRFGFAYQLRVPRDDSDAGSWYGASDAHNMRIRKANQANSRAFISGLSHE